MMRCLWLLLTVVCVGCAAQGPVLQVTDPVWNLGIIVTGSAHEKPVEISNAGDAPLRIEKVEECCGFNGILPVPAVLAPGERAIINLQVDTFMKVGDFNAELNLVSNDPKRPRFPLMAIGQVVPKVYALAESANRTIDLGVVEQGSNPPLALRIDNPGNAPLGILGIEQRGSVRPSGALPHIAPGGSGLLDFRYDATVPGPIDETLVISTSDALDRTLTVRVRGYVVPRDERRQVLVIYPLGGKAGYDVTAKAYRYQFHVHNQSLVPVALTPGTSDLPGLQLNLPARLAPGETAEASAVLPLPKTGSAEGQFELRLTLPFNVQ